MKKMNQWVLAAALIGGLTSCMSCTTNKDNAPSVEAAEYPPFKDLINVGDIHSCEPWLYSECLAKNIAVRTKKWREKREN